MHCCSPSPLIDTGYGPSDRDYQWRRGAITGEGQLSEVGAITGGGELSQVQRSYHRLRGARAGREPERSEVGGNYHRYRGAIWAGGELSQVKGI